jgi:hypothetical protein
MRGKPKLNKAHVSAKMISLLILFLSISAQSWAERLLTVTGYYKNFSILFRMPNYKIQDSNISVADLGAVTNRLRLKMDFQPWDRISFHLAYDLSAKIQDPHLFEEGALSSLLGLPEYRFGDFRDSLYPKPADSVSSFGLYQNLDRFYVTLETDFADVFIGRQAIAWGSARFINPTDIIAPFAFNELDKEERWGVDAIRLRIPLGMMDELDLGFVAGKDFKSANNAFFIRGKTYFLRTDITALLLGFRKHLLIGLDIARAIGGAGFWLESAYVIPEFFKENRDPTEKNYWRVSVGIDYNLNSKTYGFFEYHFNSPGENQPDKYFTLIPTSAFQDGSVYLFGKHYLNLGCIYQLTPLIPFTTMIVLNLSDWSMVLSPSFEYNIAENIYLAAGVYIGMGKNPELPTHSLNSISYRYQSEFGAYPDMIYTSFRIYF